MCSAWSSAIDDFQLWRKDASGSAQHKSTSSFPSLHSRSPQLSEPHVSTPSSFAQSYSDSYRSGPSKSRGSYQPNADSGQGKHLSSQPSVRIQDQDRSSGSRTFGFEDKILQKNCPSKCVVLPYQPSKTSKSSSQSKEKQTGYWRGKYRSYAFKTAKPTRGRPAAKAVANSRKNEHQAALPRPTAMHGLTPARVILDKQAGSDQSTLLLEAIEDAEGIETISIRRGDTVYRRLEDLEPGNVNHLGPCLESSDFEISAPRPLVRGGRAFTSNDKLFSGEERRVAKYGSLFQCNEEEAGRRMHDQIEIFRPDAEGWSTLMPTSKAKKGRNGRPKDSEGRKAGEVPALGAANKHADGKLGSVRLGLKSIPLLDSSDYDRQASESRSSSSYQTLQPARVPSVKQWLRSTIRGADSVQTFEKTDPAYESSIKDSDCASDMSWSDPRDVYGHSESEA